VVGQAKLKAPAYANLLRQGYGGQEAPAGRQSGKLRAQSSKQFYNAWLAGNGHLQAHNKFLWKSSLNREPSEGSDTGTAIRTIF